MASIHRTLALLIVMSPLLQRIHAAVYKVGDSSGWTTIGNIDYKSWAATKTFQLGDIIIFEYNPQFHNVMRVTHPMYKACNASAPLATYTTGNDSITITNRGHHYFFCGVPGHCQSGQKLDINVLRDTQSAAPTPSVSADPPSVPAARVPGPSLNNALPLKAPVFANLGLAVAFLLALIPNFT